MGDISSIEATEATRLIGSDPEGVETNPLAVTLNQDGHVLDRSNILAETATINITDEPTIINVNGISNMPERKSIIIQPLDGICFVGFSLGDQSIRLRRHDIAEFKIGPNIDLYVRKNGNSTHRLSVSELS